VIHVFLQVRSAPSRTRSSPKAGSSPSRHNSPRTRTRTCGRSHPAVEADDQRSKSSSLFGEGFGTRQTGFNNPLRNAPILDNQWLNNLLDVGYIGFFLWVWLFVRARADSPRGALGETTRATNGFSPVSQR
jgi:hypothetical protein